MKPPEVSGIMAIHDSAAFVRVFPAFPVVSLLFVLICRKSKPEGCPCWGSAFIRRALPLA